FVIFHANGVGGPAMEELIAQNYFAGILDYTLSEVAGYIAGGFHNGGATRLDAAGEAGLPQVIIPGCLDFMVFGAKHEIPEPFQHRPTYYHNPEFTLVRLTEEEQLAAFRFLVEKLNKAKGAVSVIVPLGGGSIMDIEGGAFWQPGTNARCYQILREGLNRSIRYQEVPAHINDTTFADAVLEEALRVLV
ncbi:MAG: Tm-1-like ATP-binding domain-containing protein, partial [Anaerolineae bacterium]|nr:Tm-1-like ATP-binding domain-containing protein [Anaerolineae bacterium]